jgi:competence protein ComEC
MQQKFVDPWKSLPFLRLLIPFLAGIILKYQGLLNIHSIQVIGIIGLSLVAIPSFLKLHQQFYFAWLRGLGIYLLLTAIGAFNYYWQQPEQHAHALGQKPLSSNTCVEIIAAPVPTTKQWRVLAKAIAQENQGQWVSVHGLVFLYSKHPEWMQELIPGKRILLTKKLQFIAAPKDPLAFNYQQWAYRQGVQYQSYLAAPPMMLEHAPRSWRNWVLDSRNWILLVLARWITDKTICGIAEALLIGYKYDLDRSLVEAYSNTGVVHIIAISGLHLGMIYGLLLWLFKPLMPLHWMRWIRPIVILIVLWGFALLTGAAPSIMRAALSFSFLLLSQSLGYQNNQLNALAASAFFLLLWNPWLIWDLGFQLSYAAVTGILLYAKTLMQWLRIKNPLLRAIWQLNALTLSAQVFTLPLVLYHFQQFPNLFLFCNLLIVPFSGLILYLEIVLLIPFPALQSILGKCISLGIGWMNGLVNRTNRLPFAVSDQLGISFSQTLVLLVFLFLFCERVKTYLCSSIQSRQQA